MWTYDPALLSDATAGPVMQVRLLLGDVNPDDPQLQDEELQFFLASESTTYMAAARAARTLSSRFSRKDGGTKKVGDLEITYGKISQTYHDLAEKLEAKGRVYQGPYAGGISASDKQANVDNADNVRSAIRVGMHNFASAQSSDPTS